MNSLIVGYGQIGKAINKVIGEASFVDIKDSSYEADSKVDVMHVCIPYSEDFDNILLAYTEQYQPSHVVIYSTVPIGTTKRFANAIHSPVEGKHPDLAESIKLMPRYIGANYPADQRFFTKYFQDLGLVTCAYMDSNFTEALKLLSTAEYGINIVFADYKKKIADKLGMDYDIMKLWNRDYNELYQKLRLPQFQKYVLDPPEGKIGGHCVRPNALLLDEQYPNEMLKMIREMGEIE